MTPTRRDFLHGALASLAALSLLGRSSDAALISDAPPAFADDDDDDWYGQREHEEFIREHREYVQWEDGQWVRDPSTEGSNRWKRTVEWREKNVPLLRLGTESESKYGLGIFVSDTDVGMERTEGLIRTFNRALSFVCQHRKIPFDVPYRAAAGQGVVYDHATGLIRVAGGAEAAPTVIRRGGLILLGKPTS